MLKKLSLLVVLSWCTAFLYSSAVYAKCSTHPIAGVWEAKKYTKLSPKIVEIIHNCDASYNGEPEWALRVFHACRPADCIWGRAVARRHLSGIFEAKFETFSATRKIKIIPSGYRIEVNYIIDYRSEHRTDLKGRVYMTRSR